MADPTGHFGKKKKKKTDKNGLFCLFPLLFSVFPSPPSVHPIIMEENEARGFQGAVAVEPDVEGVYCSAIKQNKKQKYAVWRRALANSRGGAEQGACVGEHVWVRVFGPSWVCVYVPLCTLYENPQVFNLHLIEGK